MRVALVSPYSWTYPGGVARHIEALAGELLAAGHDVSVLTPYDRDDRRTAWLHRGARPQRRPVPDWLVPLGPTIGWPSNGAVSNLAHTPTAIARLRRELRSGQFDVVHVHEPVTPVVGWDALTSADAPLVGTFHCYSESRPPHAIARSWARAASSTASRSGSPSPRPPPGPAGASTAASTGSCRTASRCRPAACPPRACARPASRSRSSFVGQAVERKGLPILLRAFEALREHVPAQLTIVGASSTEVAPLLVDHDGVTVLGRGLGRREARRARGRRRAGRAVARRRVVRHGADRGLRRRRRPSIASDIAGYRDVVRDGVDGLLVPRGDATALAETLRDLALDPRRTQALGGAAAVERGALRLAEGRRPGRRGLRRRARRAAARRRDGARGGPHRPALRRPRPAPPGAAAAVARAGARGVEADRRGSSAGPGSPPRASAWRAAPTWRSSTSASTGSAARS